MAASPNPFLADKSRPIVVGHRGVPALHQENTLAGFRRALQLGVPAVELDVRLTADRRAVVIHDDDLERLTGEPGRVGALTWDELSRRRLQREVPMGVDALGRPVVLRYEQREPIPLLAEVLAEVGGKIAINVELKLDLPRWWPAGVGEVVATAIAAAGTPTLDRVIVTSFDPRKLRAARRVRHDLAIGFCFDDGMLAALAPILDRLLPAPASADDRDGRPGHHARRLLGRIVDSHFIGDLLRAPLVGAEHTLVGADTVRRLHARGVAIGTHTLFPIGSTTGKRLSTTASQIAEVHRLVALGVDWIETDDPERLLKLIG
nr:glycerophosphodiester phosphodiesterase family protein [Kofleriaceae bacterium]